MRFRQSPRILWIGLLCLLSFPAAAQSYSSAKGMDESFRIDLGGFFQKFDTSIRLDSSSLGTGTEINLEDVLGQDTSKTSFRADGYYRFGRHGSVQFAFLTWSRSSARVLTQDIEFGDHIFHAGVNTASKTSLTDAELYYGYSFINSGDLEFGLQLGISALFVSASLEASGFITGPGGTLTSGVVVEDHSVTAPVPAIGGFFRFTLLPRFFLFARAKGLPKVTISGYYASMFDGRVGLDYYFTKSFGMGGAYSYTKFTYGHNGSDSLRLDMTYSGPMVYVTLAF